jgi:SAM-dependent methyltransferase
MKKIIPHIFYLSRVLRRSLLCRYCNIRNRLLHATESALIQIHEAQKKTFTFDLVKNQEENKKDLANKLNFIKKKYVRCLEIGCETGWFGKELLDHNLTNKYLGIEMRAHELTKALDPRLTLVAARAEYLPVKNITFDLIVALHVLEHVGDPTALRDELRSCTDGNAHFLIAVPLGYDSDPAHRWHFMNHKGWKKYFENRYGFAALEAGVFTTTRTEYLGLFTWKAKPRPPA